MEGRENGVIHPLRMAVPGQLVPVEIGDDELRGVEVAEALAAYRSSDSISSTSARTRPVRDAWVSTSVVTPLDLVGALFIVDHGFAPGPQDGGDHLHGGGFAVGAGDGDDVAGQLDPGEDIGADLQGRICRA